MYSFFYCNHDTCIIDYHLAIYMTSFNITTYHITKRL